MTKIATLRCVDVRLLLVDWSLGGLTADAHTRIDEHLSACNDCLAEALSTRRVLCCDEEAVTLPGLEQEVLGSFRTETRRRLLRRPVLAGIGLAVAASVLLAAAVIFQMKKQSDISDSGQETAPMSMEYERIFSDQTTIL